MTEAAKKKKSHAPKYRNPGRYRLDFIKENTFNRIWTVRMTRGKVWLASITFIASVCALILVIVLFTPVRQLLPGKMERDIRSRYLETALKLDSLEQVTHARNAYLENIIAILTGTVDEPGEITDPNAAYSDSLLDASDAERHFVRQYESEERFNLSVLAPIAAEGMIFYSPSGAAARVIAGSDPRAMTISGGKTTPAQAVYRGTVISVMTDMDGLSAVTVQHPNEFVSIYSGLREVFISPGDKVSAGQRLGHTPPDRPLTYRLWHGGSALDPADYISLEN